MANITTNLPDVDREKQKLFATLPKTTGEWTDNKNPIDGILFILQDNKLKFAPIEPSSH